MNRREYRFPDNPDWNGSYIVIHDGRCQFTLLPLSLADNDFNIRNTHLASSQDFLTEFGPDYYVMVEDYLFKLPFLMTDHGVSCVRAVRHRKPSENLAQLCILIGPCTQQQIITLKQYASNNEGLLPPLPHWHEHNHQCDEITPHIVTDYDNEDDSDDAILRRLARELDYTNERYSSHYTYNPVLRTVDSFEEQEINTTIQHNNPYPPIRICPVPIPLLTTIMIGWANQPKIQQEYNFEKNDPDKNSREVNKKPFPLFPSKKFFNAVQNSSSSTMTCQRCVKHAHVVTDLERKDDISEKQFIFEQIWRHNHQNLLKDKSILLKTYQSSWLSTANQFCLLNDYLPGSIQFMGAPNDKYLIFHKSCHYRWDVIGVYIYGKEESYDTTPAFPDLDDFSNYSRLYNS